MTKTLFDTKAKIEAGINGFTELQNHGGWKLFIQIIEGNIKYCTQRILTKKEGDEVLSNKQIDRERDRLAVFEEVKNLPKKKIKELSSPEQEVPNPDPYHTADSLKKERKEQSG